MSFKNTAIKAALKAGKTILLQQNKLNDIKFKSKQDICTEADIKSERIIIDIIKKDFPSHNIISEEQGITSKNSEYTWIIDPLDGTIFFSKSIPLFSVSIGLKHNDEIILGVAYLPVTDELFFAEKGKGAYLNGKKITVSSIDTISQSFITIDYKPTKGNINKGIDLMKVIANESFFTRALACQVIEFVYIACGRSEGNICYSTKLWDLAAAKIILEEAGGKITDFNGDKINLNNHEFNVVSSNKKVHNKLIELINKRGS